MTILLLELPVKYLIRSICSASVLLLAFTANAAPVELSGVKLEDAVDTQGTRLQLNGAGIRYKAFFKVYTAGLYLGKKAGTLEEVIAACPAPGRD